MHFHGVEYAFGSDGVVHPRLLRRGRERHARQLVHLPAQGRARQSKGVWPYHDHSPSMMESIHGGMYGALSILGRNERRPTGSSSSSLSDRRLRDDQRPRLRRQHAGATTRGSATSCSGTCSRSATSSTPSTSTATAGCATAAARGHAHDRPRRELRRPLARGRAGDVALPLPRGGPHGARHDRPLPGQPVRRSWSRSRPRSCCRPARARSRTRWRSPGASTRRRSSSCWSGTR